MPWNRLIGIVVVIALLQNPILAGSYPAECLSTPKGKAVSGTVSIDSDKITFFSKKHTEVVPVSSIERITGGEFAKKRVKGALLGSLVSPFALFALIGKKKREVFSVEYETSDGDTKAFVFQVKKRFGFSVEAALEASTGHEVEWQEQRGPEETRVAREESQTRPEERPIRPATAPEPPPPPVLETAAIQAAERARQHDAEDLVNLIQEARVEVMARGAGIDKVSLKMRTSGEGDLKAFIPVGTFFVSSRASTQNMVTTQSSTVELASGDWKSLTVRAACANRPRDIPGSNDAFTVQRSPAQAELANLAPLLEDSRLSLAVRQAAVWIVTDNASYSDLGVLVSRPVGASSGIGSLGRKINEYETAMAMKICADAGIDITRKAIWQSRELILAGLRDEELKAWIESFDPELARRETVAEAAPRPAVSTGLDEARVVLSLERLYKGSDLPAEIRENLRLSGQRLPDPVEGSHFALVQLVFKRINDIHVVAPDKQSVLRDAAGGEYEPVHAGIRGIQFLGNTLSSPSWVVEDAIATLIFELPQSRKPSQVEFAYTYKEGWDRESEAMWKRLELQVGRVTVELPDEKPEPAHAPAPAPPPTRPLSPGELPTYEQVVASYRPGTALCKTRAGISPAGEDGYSFSNLGEQRASFSIRGGQMLGLCFGGKYVVKEELELEDGSIVKPGAKLTVNADLELVQVSGWE